MCKVSVVIPVYNAEISIKNTLNNVRNQTLEEIEIICIDDGSADNTAEIIREIQNQDNRIRYVYQKNQGAGEARNNGIRTSAGDYIAFMDGDDFYPDEFALEKLYLAAESNQAMICGGSIEGEFTEENKKRIFEKEGFIKFSDFQCDFFFSRYIFNKSFLAENNLFFPSLRVYEDPVFLLKTMVEAGEFYAITDSVYKFTGTHHIYSMNVDKVKDYLKGIIQSLGISSQYRLRELHKEIVFRLEHEAEYYAGQYLYTDDQELLCLLLQANSSIDKLLIDMDRNYVLPSILSIWYAACKYMKFRNSMPVKAVRKILKK